MEGKLGKIRVNKKNVRLMNLVWQDVKRKDLKYLNPDVFEEMLASLLFHILMDQPINKEEEWRKRWNNMRIDWINWTFVWISSEEFLRSSEPYERK
jgi:hypothetical protein